MIFNRLYICKGDVGIYYKRDGTIRQARDRVEGLLGLKLIVMIVKSHSLLHSHWVFRGRSNFGVLGLRHSLPIFNDLPKVNSSIFFSQGFKAK
jgi:hypothetical protein